MFSIPTLGCPSPSIAGAVCVAVAVLGLANPIFAKEMIAKIPRVEPLPRWKSVAWSLAEPIIYFVVPFTYWRLAGDLWGGTVDPDLWSGLGVVLSFFISTAVHANIIERTPDETGEIRRFGSAAVHSLPVFLPAAVIVVLL